MGATTGQVSVTTALGHGEQREVRSLLFHRRPYEPQPRGGVGARVAINARDSPGRRQLHSREPASFTVTLRTDDQATGYGGGGATTGPVR